MNDQATNQIVVDIAGGLIREYVPQEMSVFRAQSKIFLTNPEAVLNPPKSREQITGSGTGLEMVLVSPVIMAAMQEVIKFLIEEAKKALAGESAALIQEYVKAFFKKLSPEQEGEDKEKETEKEEQAPPKKIGEGAKTTSHPRRTNKLTPGQARKIREIVFEQMIIGKISPAKANLLADAVVGELYIS